MNIHSRLYHTLKNIQTSQFETILLKNIVILKQAFDKHCTLKACFGSIFYEHLSRIVSYFALLICAQCSLASSDRPIIMLCIRPVANPCISDCSYFLLECDTSSNWICYMCALDSSQNPCISDAKYTHLLKFSRWTIFDIIF